MSGTFREEMYPPVGRLLSCYFHEDWDSDYESVDDAVSAFIEETPIDLARETAEELKRLSGEGKEADLHELLLTLGLRISLRRLNCTPVRFLESLAGHIERSIRNLGDKSGE